MTKYKVGDLVEWSWDNVPQFLAIVIIVGVRIVPSGELDGIHYLRLVDLSGGHSGIGKIGWVKHGDNGIPKMGKLRIVSG